MRIRLGILDMDALYKTRLINYFNAYYADKLEIFSFSDVGTMQQYLSGKRLDVILADEHSVPDPRVVDKGIAFAYWSEAANVDSIRNIKAVCKYQKAELIYKEILSLFAEVESNVTSYRMGDGSRSTVVTFLGAGGGVGATTAAAGCAMYLANNGKRTLFLDLTELGCTASYFHSEGSFTLSEALYAIKSNHSNLFLKLESMVKRDVDNGVSFYDSARVALDMRDATADNLKTLLNCLAESKSFDFIVVDADTQMSAKQNVILEASAAVVLVSDGGPTANAKMVRLAEAYRLDPSTGKAGRKLHVMYNRCHTGAQKVRIEDVVELGDVNVFKNADAARIAAEIANRGVFRRFIAKPEG